MVAAFFFSLFCFPFGETEQGEEPERRAQIWKAGVAFKEKLKRTKKGGGRKGIKGKAAMDSRGAQPDPEMASICTLLPGAVQHAH